MQLIVKQRKNVETNATNEYTTLEQNKTANESKVISPNKIFIFL